MSGDGFLVVVTLQPKPLSSLHLDRRFTRIDYTSRCTMLDVLEGMARILKVDRADLTLEAEGGANVVLEQVLAEYHDQHSQKKYSCSSFGERKTHQRWPRHMKRQRREINLIVRHVPLPHKLVTCTVESGDDGDELRRTTVQLPNTATFGELLLHARNQRRGGLEFEGPIYGKAGELDTTLRDAWVRDGCKVDGALHVGLSVVVSFPGASQKSLSLVMGPSDTIGDVKQRVCCHQGVAPSRQSVTVRGETQKLEDTAALKELCAAGAQRSLRAVPVELHLEVIVKETALPLQSLSQAVLGDGIDPSTSAPFACSFFDTGKESRVQDACLSLPPPPPGVAPKSDTHAHGGVDSFIATRSSVGRTAKNPTQGYGCRSIALFALSPSGRALALKVSGAATVLQAKEQVATYEGVPPCQQRLLWRGVPLQPDHASLYKIGIRGGDTLVVGYRFPRATPDVPTPVDGVEGGTSNDVVAMGGIKGATDARESGCVINLKDDGLVRQEHVPESFIAEGGGRKTVKERKGTDRIHSADARAANGGLDIAGGSGSDGSDGSTGNGGGHGVSGASGSSGGSSSAAAQGREKGSGRRTWWLKKARNSRNVNHQERDNVSVGGVGGAAAAAASSASAAHTHSAPPPSPLQPARDASGGTGGVDGISRNTESASAAPNYLLAATRRTSQQPTPVVLGGNFSAWVRRKRGRRTPTPSASSADGGSGE